ncbi:hypothetical protein B0H34DRAFT_807729 [Crassisporium funariophilum]|nr:hypothetical protein B0H34DRAFT_807729 [Crassisporium funariophilum]
MGRRRKTALTSIANLKKTPEERATKRQKREDMRLSSGKENQNTITPINTASSSCSESGVPMDIDPSKNMRSRFHSMAPKGSLAADILGPPEQYFTEFYVNTQPDPEDFFEEDLELPDLVVVSDDDSDDDDSDSESDSDSDDDETANIHPGGGGAPQSHADRDSPHSQAAESPGVGPTTSRQCEKGTSFTGKGREAPTQLQAHEALKALEHTLNPPRKTGRGHVDPKLDPFVRRRMEGMASLLRLYTSKSSKTYDAWGGSSYQAAIAVGHGRYCARQLRIMARQFIKDGKTLPINPYGNWNESMLVDEDLANEITLYLQEIGPEISAKKIQAFLARDEVREKHGITKTISERTARRYLNTLGYRFTTPKKGQYADGHEREDVVYYREQVFLPEWRAMQDRMSNWSNDNLLEYGPSVNGRRVIVWFHDKSIFYAHNRRKRGWYHKDAPAKPYAKGEGSSLMIADYVSADFGWLRSKNGRRSARRIMKPGKNKDGYFTADDIKAQAIEAMDILTESYPDFEHVFV